MPANTKFKLRGRSKDSYLRLIEELPLSSLKSDDHLDLALQTIDLLSAKALDKGAQIYLEALLDLVEVYEDVHKPISMASDSAQLQHLMEANNVTQAQVSGASGIAKSTISEILHGKRSLTQGNISKLAAFFKIDVSVLSGNLCK